jgi:hypothetical protein
VIEYSGENLRNRIANSSAVRAKTNDELITGPNWLDMCCTCAKRSINHSNHLWPEKREQWLEEYSRRFKWWLFVFFVCLLWGGLTTTVPRVGRTDNQKLSYNHLLFSSQGGGV